jgi:DNA modification methylase
MNKIEFGDCRGIMSDWNLLGTKVQMCVTSPPYFGLRDYGVSGQLGLENTPDEYVKNMVETFHLVRDLLADDGTLWLNLGDSYTSDIKGSGGRGKSTLGPNKDLQNIEFQKMAPRRFNCGVKPKNLLGIPWRTALALQADGWYLRQDIIWHKPNAMPESVTDRCTKAHEYIFLLSKSKKYYFDSQSISEPLKTNPKENYPARAKILGRGKQESRSQTPGAQSQQDSSGGYPPNASGRRNRRSVWTVTTKPYKGAHFATFPPDLIEPCILAGSRSGDIVLDPFMGSGTTAQVALKHGRRYLGCELNPEYEKLQLERIAKVTSL